MKALHHETGLKERIARPFAALAVAGTIMLSGCAAHTQYTCVPPRFQGCSERIRVFSEKSEAVDVYGIKARVVYTLHQFSRLLQDYPTYRNKEAAEIDNKGGRGILFASKVTSTLNEREWASMMVYQRDPVFMFSARFQFITMLSPDVHSWFYVDFDPAIDHQPTDPASPGIRKIDVGRFPEPIFSSMSDAIVVVDKLEDNMRRSNVGPAYSVFALPRSADGKILGNTPLGQLAYAVTFDPMTREATGGWAVLREPDIGGTPEPMPLAPPSTRRNTFGWYDKINSSARLGQPPNAAGEFAPER